MPCDCVVGRRREVCVSGCHPAEVAAPATAFCRRPLRLSRAMSMPELPHYSPEVLALWNEKDEEASEKWRQDKIKDFEAGGA